MITSIQSTSPAPRTAAPSQAPPAEPKDTFQPSGPVFANGFVSGFVNGSVSGFIPGSVNGTLSGSITGTLMGSDGKSYPVNTFVNIPVTMMANGVVTAAPKESSGTP